MTSHVFVQTSPTGDRLRLFHSEEKEISTTENLASFVAKAVGSTVTDTEMDGMDPEVEAQLDALADVNETETGESEQGENEISLHTAMEGHSE